MLKVSVLNFFREISLLSTKVKIVPIFWSLEKNLWIEVDIEFYALILQYADPKLTCGPEICY